MSHQTIGTRDLYEASYYMMLGAKLDGINVVEENSKQVCHFILTGDVLTTAQLHYFNGDAKVNLLDFRRAYMRLHSMIGSARREAMKKAKTGGEA